MLDLIAQMESEVRGYVRAFPTVFDTASGAHITDHTGRTFIDFFAGAGTLNYGHNHPRAKRAVLDYVARDGLQHALDMASAAKVKFLQTFKNVILDPRGLDYKVQFTGPTGTNAVEAAIKLARKAKQRSHVVAFTNAYHGHTLGALALTGNQFYHDEHFGSHNNVTHLPYDGYLPGLDSAKLMQRLLDDPSSGLPQPAAVILETIQCEGGIHVASTEWIQRVRDICHQRDILLIVDDIQVGNGRTGKFFSFEDAVIEPDLVCLSKSIGGGLPMSLVLIDRKCDVWQPGQHTGTFRGNNLAFVAAEALLSYWRDDGLEQQVLEHGRTMRKTLEDIAYSYPDRVTDVRGRGMVWGIELTDSEVAGQIVQDLFRRGLIIETAGAEGQVVKLLPPLTITRDVMKEGLRLLGESFAAVLGTGVPAAELPASDKSDVDIPLDTRTLD